MDLGKYDLISMILAGGALHAYLALLYPSFKSISVPCYSVCGVAMVRPVYSPPHPFELLYLGESHLARATRMHHRFSFCILISKVRYVRILR